MEITKINKMYQKRKYLLRIYYNRIICYVFNETYKVYNDSKRKM
jgi:hypothetical protein